MATMRSSTARVRTMISWIRFNSAGSRSATAVMAGSSALRFARGGMSAASGLEEEVADLPVEVGVAFDHRPVPALGPDREVGVLQDPLEVVGVRDRDDLGLPPVDDQGPVGQLLQLVVRDGHGLDPPLPRCG